MSWAWAEMIRHKAATEIAERMICDRLTCSQIRTYTRLDDDTIQELAFETGVILPDTDFRRLVRNTARRKQADASAAGG